MASKRYEFRCVAPEVQGPGPTDDLDEAIRFVTADYYGSHFEIWDTQTQRYVTPGPEDRPIDIHLPGTLQTPPMTLRPQAVENLGQAETVVGQLAVLTKEPGKGRVHVYTGKAQGWIPLSPPEQEPVTEARPQEDRSPTAAELRSVLLFLNRCREAVGKTSEELRWMDATNAILQSLSLQEGRSIGDIAAEFRQQDRAVWERQQECLPPIPPEARWEGGTGAKG